MIKYRMPRGLTTRVRRADRTDPEFALHLPPRPLLTLASILALPSNMEERIHIRAASAKALETNKQKDYGDCPVDA